MKVERLSSEISENVDCFVELRKRIRILLDLANVCLELWLSCLLESSCQRTNLVIVWASLRATNTKAIKILVLPNQALIRLTLRIAEPSCRSDCAV